MSRFVAEEEVHQGLQIRGMIKGLWPFARPYPGLLTAAVTTMLITIVSARLLPQTIGYAIDHGVVARDLNVFLQTAWVYLALEIVHAVSQFAYAYLFQRFGNRLLADLREGLLSHIQSLPLDYFHRNPVGRIVTRLTNDPANLNEVFSEGLVSILMNLLVLISIVVSMFLISWKLTFLAMGLMPLFLWASMAVSHRMRVILRDSKKKLSALNSYASERLQGLKVLQVLGAMPSTNAKFVEQSEDYKELLLKSQRMNALMQPIMNLATACLIAISLGAGGWLKLEDGLALGSLVAFLLHAQDFIPPLREILEKYQQFQNSLTSAERVFPLFDERREESPAELLVAENAPRLRLRGDLEIRDLWFRYEAEHPWVFQGLNIKIEAGQKVALMGRTGAGKSTLISLLQRFYEAPLDTIFLDGQPLNQIPRQHLRQWMGVVQQDPVLFRGTIADNLTLNDPSRDRSQIQKALEDVGAWSLLTRSGRDLDSWVEERGANLSLGERQLLCFARILVFDPGFLILDEATANVDSETEALIQRAVEKVTAGRTSLIIAHRLSTLRHCDLFYEVKDGQARPHVP